MKFKEEFINQITNQVKLLKSVIDMIDISINDQIIKEDSQSNKPNNNQEFNSYQNYNENDYNLHNIVMNRKTERNILNTPSNIINRVNQTNDRSIIKPNIEDNNIKLSNNEQNHHNNCFDQINNIINSQKMKNEVDQFQNDLKIKKIDKSTNETEKWYENNNEYQSMEYDSYVNSKYEKSECTKEDYLKSELASINKKNKFKFLQLENLNCLSFDPSKIPQVTFEKSRNRYRFIYKVKNQEKLMQSVPVQHKTWEQINKQILKNILPLCKDYIGISDELIQKYCNKLNLND